MKEKIQFNNEKDIDSEDSWTRANEKDTYGNSESSVKKSKQMQSGIFYHKINKGKSI